MGRHVVVPEDFRGLDMGHVLLHEKLHVVTGRVWQTNIPQNRLAEPQDFTLVRHGFGPGGSRVLSAMREYITEKAAVRAGQVHGPRAGLDLAQQSGYSKIMRLGDYAIEHAAASPRLREVVTPDSLLTNLQRGLITANPTPLMAVARTLPHGLRREIANLNPRVPAQADFVYNLLSSYRRLHGLQ
jgi:hypothetical protein